MTKRSENWRSIPPFELDVSDKGRVRRTKGTFERYPLRVAVDADGHPYIVLLDKSNGQFRPHHIWRLVAHAYLDLPLSDEPNEAQPVVKHKDGNILNNAPGNLIVNTRPVQVSSGQRRKRKLSDKEAAYIKHLVHNERWAIADVRDWLNEEFEFETPVTYQNVRAVVKGRTYREVTARAPS